MTFHITTAEVIHTDRYFSSKSEYFEKVVHVTYEKIEEPFPTDSCGTDWNYGRFDLYTLYKGTKVFLTANLYVRVEKDSEGLDMIDGSVQGIYDAYIKSNIEDLVPNHYSPNFTDLEGRIETNPKYIIEFH